MSAQSILNTMEKQLKLHQSLYDLAQKKTEIIKKGDMPALNKIMIHEQNHVKAIGMLEKERESYVNTFLAGQPSGTERTLTECIRTAAPEEAEALQSQKVRLSELILKLKDVNYLNQQLIYQSLQFINLSLDMVRPKQQNFNYEKPVQQKGQKPAGSRSYFNSRA
ncbi:flagellar protein FlgN [Peribacillus sp. SCS-37]|uniref:flagellar protein FlgN n=1 Tax=Paraperibacillus esterisolvens TaxID=3115296 RepID=UPI003906B6B2